MGKKVISFSLYGKHPKYSRGAIANARHANRAYPGWICRFYVADDVREGVIARLKDYGAEVISMGPHIGHEAMFWRVFATVDPENDITIVRDADSRFTKCELLMVNEWLASNKKFHVMRGVGDYPTPIMGGLWGVRGGIPNLRESLMACKRPEKGVDERFLMDNLYPQMKGKVFVHAIDSHMKQRYFIGETSHPFAHRNQGKFLFPSLPVGFMMPARRTFIAFSIYKRTIFSEFLLTIWLGVMGKSILFSRKNIRFYVADNISQGLIERLRRYGRVVLKPAKTVYDDDPEYWKLLILSENGLDAAVIVDFWQVFFLAKMQKKGEKIRLYELLPIEHDLPTGIRSWFTNIPVLSACGPAPPVSDIENLVARRDPNENYREFIRSTVYPRTSSTRMVSVLKSRDNVGFMQGLARILVPLRLSVALGRVVRSLERSGTRWVKK